MSRQLLQNGAIAAAVILLVTAVAWHKGAFDPPAGGPEGVDSGLPRMVDFGSTVCPDCKKMAPILAELREEYAGRAIIQFIDVVEDPAAGDFYPYRVMPTQVFYDRDGQEHWAHEGFLPREEIVRILGELGAEPPE